MQIVNPVSRTASSKSSGFLRQLGLVGLDAVEPVILAALATQTPLLLIGAHGTAKSLLLCRLCEALGLQWRHYNASLVNYDDLVGYPLPDANGKLSFVQTPASVWNAQAVFIDELSRARPDMLNRLFPIIHEKKVQGIALDQLRYRWSAMNPPTSDETAATENYVGSEPLDPALADRFGFVVEIPAWSDLTNADQLSVITSDFGPVCPHLSRALIETIERVNEQLVMVDHALGEVLSNYVSAIGAHAANLGIVISGRRAAMLYRNLLAVHAVELNRSASIDIADSSWKTLVYSLPHRAQGIKIDTGRLLVAHNAAWKTLRMEAADPRRLLAHEKDPVRHALMAAQFHSLSRQDFSSYVADALATLTAGGRHALALFIMESGAIERLIAAVAEQVAQLYQVVALAQDANSSIQSQSAKHEAWEEIVARVASMPSTDSNEGYVHNLLVGLFMGGYINTKDDIPHVIQSWDEVRLLTTRAPRAEDALKNSPEQKQAEAA